MVVAMMAALAFALFPVSTDAQLWPASHRLATAASAFAIPLSRPRVAGWRLRQPRTLRRVRRYPGAPPAPRGTRRLPAPTAPVAAPAAPSREERVVLEVVVAGGGVAGLFIALMLATTLRGQKRTRVYDGRWRRGKKAVEWSPRALSDGACDSVTIPHSFWSQLPVELQQAVFPAGSYIRQLPSESDAGPAHAWNVDLQGLEDRLLELAQEGPYSDFIELCPAPYSKDEHWRVAREEPFHALVLADGLEARELRDEAFQGYFGIDTAQDPQPPQDYVQVMFDLGDAAGRFNIAESTVLSLSQKRYSLSACGPNRGHMSMMLVDAEKRELSQSVGASEDVKMRIQEGLRLFGIPEEAVCGTSIFRTFLLKRMAYCAELSTYSVPQMPAEDDEEESGGMLHPYAFVVGEAADTASGWPGSRLRNALKGVPKAVEQLVAIRQGLCSGWSSTKSTAAEYNQSMTLLQAEAASVFSLHSALPKVIQRALQAAERDPGDGDASEGFLDAVKGTHAYLSAGTLPLERAEELPSARELCERLTDAGLSPRTLQVLKATGPWVAAATVTEVSGLTRNRATGSEQAAHPTKPQSLDGAKEVPKRKDAAKESPKKAYNRGVRFLKGKGVEKDPEQAAACLFEAAQQGHREAQYAIGVMFLKGDGLPKNENYAAYWLAAAAEKGHPKAQYNLGIMCQHGVGIERDMEMASAWTMRAAERGHKKALKSNRVIAFGAGPWMDLDPKEMGVDAIAEQAERGDINAQFKLGMMYSEGEAVEQDKPKASFWFMQAAQRGLAEAQYQMSRMLLLGDGVQQDIPYGMRFLEEAAKQGHMEAQHNLGCKLYFGEDIDSDRMAAGYWFLEAAKQGLPESQNNIGWMLAIGDGVQQNMKEGRRWLQEAASRGNMEASGHLSSLSGRVVAPEF